VSINYAGSVISVFDSKIDSCGGCGAGKPVDLPPDLPMLCKRNRAWSSIGDRCAA